MSYSDIWNEIYGNTTRDRYINQTLNFSNNEDTGIEWPEMPSQPTTGSVVNNYYGDGGGSGGGVETPTVNTYTGWSYGQGDAGKPTVNNNITQHNPNGASPGFNQWASSSPANNPYVASSWAR